MIDNSQMGFIISDQEQNIVVYKYQPEARESLGGKLISLNVGAITVFILMNCIWTIIYIFYRPLVKWNKIKIRVSICSVVKKIFLSDYISILISLLLNQTHKIRKLVSSVLNFDLSHI